MTKKKMILLKKLLFLCWVVFYGTEFLISFPKFFSFGHWKKLIKKTFFIAILYTLHNHFYNKLYIYLHFGYIIIMCQHNFIYFYLIYSIYAFKHLSRWVVYAFKHLSRDDPLRDTPPPLPPHHLFEKFK